MKQLKIAYKLVNNNREPDLNNNRCRHIYSQFPFNFNKHKLKFELMTII